jgi:hypothetical protein
MTRTTAWAARVDDAEYTFEADSRDEAIDIAIQDAIDRGHWDMDESPVETEVFLYQDCRWCEPTREELDSDEECPCGGDHSEYDAIMYGWGERSTVTVRVTLGEDCDDSWEVLP